MAKGSIFDRAHALRRGTSSASSGTTPPDDEQSQVRQPGESLDDLLRNRGRDDALPPESPSAPGGPTLEDLLRSQGVTQHKPKRGRRIIEDSILATRGPRGRRDSFIFALGARGLRYPHEHWPVRFLIATLAAQEARALVVLAGATGTGKTQIVKQTASTFGLGSRVVAVRPEWLAATSLLGFVDPISGRFSGTDFVASVREAGAIEQGGAGPYLLLLDEMNLARIENYGADLLGVIEEEPGPRREIRLYSEYQHQAWLRERERLAGRRAGGTLGPAEDDRLDELEAILGESDGAHILRLPASLVVCGTLNTDRHTEQLSPKVLDRSLVLQAPRPSVASLFEPRPAGDAAAAGLRLPKRPPPADWNQHPNVRDPFIKAATELESVGVMISARTERLANAFLRWAQAYYDLSEDADVVVAALVHMFLLPRLECRPADALEPLKKIADVLGTGRATDVTAEVEALLRIAEEGKVGVLRGLR